MISEYNSGYLGSQIVALLRKVDILTEEAVAWPWEPYDPDTEYVPLSKVAYQGSSYICTQECRGVAPTDTDYWLMIAQGGRGVEFNVSDTHIRYRYTGDAEWINVIAIADLKGEEGDLGKGLEFNWNGTQLGIRVEGEASYQYVNLKGAKGDTGDQGIQGATGKNIEFIWSGTQLGVRQEGQTSYTYANLKGDQGPKGLDGYTPVKGIDYFDGEKGKQGDIGPKGETGETGAPGLSLSLKVNRQYDTYEDLPVSADIGYMCLVGLELHIYTENGWVNAGKLTKIDYDLFMHIDGGLFTDEYGVIIGESALEALQDHTTDDDTHANLIIDGTEV